MIRFVSMSLGAVGSSDGSDPLALAVNAAAYAGIVAVVAAGNAGPDYYSVSTPAAASQAITVCATRDPSMSGWTLAPWSSRGPTYDNRVKPDICAPGYKVTAPMAGTTNRYTTMSGTSMATPFISGTVALMLAANPYLTVDEVKDILYGTAQDWAAAGQDLDYGHGLVDVHRAVSEAMGFSSASAPANGPYHGSGSSNINSGANQWWYFYVDDTTAPIGLTMLMTDAMDRYYDLDMYLYDPDGYLVSYSFGVTRQETINYRPLKPGFYFIRINAYDGYGAYTIDASFR